jgi:preprotein translocase subunit SecY
MKHCPNRGCPHYRRVHAPAEYHDEIAACHDCGAVLVDGAVPEEAARAQPVGADLWKRLAVTLALFPAMFALSWVSIPGLDTNAFAAYAARERFLWLGISRANLSVFAVGILPFVTAAVVVEIAALVVPRWRALRAGAAGRRKLGWAALALGLVLCVNQAYTLAVVLAQMTDFFDGSVLTTTLTLTAGAAALVVVAGLLSRHGLVNGFALMLAYTYAGREIGAFAHHVTTSGEPTPPGRILMPVGATLAAMVVVARILTVRRPPRADLDPGPHAPAVDTYRDRRTTHLEPLVRVPAAGLVPVLAASVLLSLPSAVAVVDIPGAHDLALALMNSPVGYLAVYAGLTVAVLLLCVPWLHGTEALVRRWTRGEAAEDDHAMAGAVRGELRASTRRSAILLGGAVVVCTVAKTALGDFPTAITLLGLSALALDLADEWRARRAHADLVAVGSTHEIDAADVAATALAAAGIPVLLRGGWSRAMLQILGPYVPIELLVPAPRAGEASGMLRKLIGADLLGGEEAKEEEAPRRAEKRRKKKAQPVEDAG